MPSCWRRKPDFRLYSLAEAKKRVFAGARGYLPWLDHGRLCQGLCRGRKALPGTAPSAVSAWGKPEHKRTTRGKSRLIPADIPLFTLQGNFDVKKLHGVYRLMMEIMVKTAGKGLAEKKDRTPEEDDMLDMMLHGGERVKEENLGAVLDWYSAQR